MCSKGVNCQPIFVPAGGKEEGIAGGPGRGTLFLLYFGSWYALKSRTEAFEYARICISGRGCSCKSVCHEGGVGAARGNSRLG